MTGPALDIALLAGGAVLIAAVAGVRVSSRIGVPSLLIYLGIGVALGGEGIGVHVRHLATARDLALVALAVIVAEGGLTTDWALVRPTLPYATALSTIGVAVSTTVVAVVAHLTLGVSWRSSIVVGAAVSATDAAATFATLRVLPLPRRLVGLLEAESGFNDPPVVIVVSLLTAGHSGAGDLAWHFAYELVVGAAIGAAVGALAIAGLRRAALPAVGLYPVATMALAVTSYAAAASVQASGFLAVYLTALAMGNASLPHRRATAGFAEGLAWLAQIGLFVLLGLLVTPSRLPGAVLPALAISAVLLVLARPLSVVASTPGRAFRWRERWFVSIAGLRGAVPVVLATIPLTAHTAGATRIFDVVVVLVALLTLVQSPVLAPAARRLGLVDADRGREMDVEAAPLDRLAADLLTVHIGSRSRLHGVEVWELRLPPNAAVAFVVRAGSGFVPESRTTLKRGDDLLVITPRANRDEVERRIRRVARGGRLAGFVDE